MNTVVLLKWTLRAINEQYCFQKPFECLSLRRERDISKIFLKRFSTAKTTPQGQRQILDVRQLTDNNEFALKLENLLTPMKSFR